MLATMLERIHTGKADVALFDQFQKVIDFNRGKGYCALINMPGPPIMSACDCFVKTSSFIFDTAATFKPSNRDSLRAMWKQSFFQPRSCLSCSRTRLSAN